MVYLYKRQMKPRWRIADILSQLLASPQQNSKAVTPPCRWWIILYPEIIIPKFLTSLSLLLRQMSGRVIFLSYTCLELHSENTLCNVSTVANLFHSFRVIFIGVSSIQTNFSQNLLCGTDSWKDISLTANYNLGVFNFRTNWYTSSTSYAFLTSSFSHHLQESNSLIPFSDWHLGLVLAESKM